MSESENLGDVKKSKLLKNSKPLPKESDIAQKTATENVASKAKPKLKLVLKKPPLSQIKSKGAKAEDVKENKEELLDKKSAVEDSNKTEVNSSEKIIKKIQVVDAKPLEKLNLNPSVQVSRKTAIVAKNNDSLPQLGKTSSQGGVQKRVAGQVGGRYVGADKKNIIKPIKREGGTSDNKKSFKISSLNKAFEIPADHGVKRKSLVQKKVNYSKKKVPDEKEFDIAKKKTQSLEAVPKKIDIMNYITPGELARKMNLKAGDIISKLISMGTMTSINEQIDSDTASIIAAEYGCEVHIIDMYEETVIEREISDGKNIVPRAPIVTVMGHVDHGKTKLLDAIRTSNVANKEFGGITQHIGAYKIHVKDKGDIVFIDTPGHAAFTAMRARGAKVTDIVVLVVAANDGVMSQTIEAIDHAKAADVPVIVAINKCDLAQSNPERVKQQLSEYGLTPEEWGGNTAYCNISALKKEGIEELLETILVQAEVLELKADTSIRAIGTVLESKIDPGRGVVSTILVKEGTLHKDDDFVAGIYQGHVRTIIDDNGNRLKEAGPSTPVEITGMSDVPKAGDPFQVTVDEKKAKDVATKRQELERLGKFKTFKRVTLDNVYQTIEECNILTLNVVIKGDVQGSVEALDNALSKLATSKIRLNVLRAAAGAIIEDDVNLAASVDGGAIIIAFNVRPTQRAESKAANEKIEIRKYNVIYDVIEDMKLAMSGKLEPIKKEVEVGKLEVREIFRVPKVGIVAGCMVVKGKITRKCYVRVIRENIQLSQEPVKLSSLKRFKDDVKDVQEGFECGVGLINFQNIEKGDVLEAVEIVEIAQKLDFAEV